MELQSLGATASSRAVVRGPEIRKSLRVPYEHGIHARPAALLAAALRSFSADVTALAHGRKANARSAVAWMELGVQRGDELALSAVGPDASEAVAALEAAFAATPAPRVSRGPAERRAIAVASAKWKPAAQVEERSLRGVVPGRGLRAR